ncbi:MAG TPA: sulfate ABC transporter permease subunit CysT [Aliidongia sp.]|uniref:sulfate ABC transporter permease subunit CysT n=1 Tax=Aliidongia sp. TaxID=1914230 RepID=UPI002DDD7CF7|nr:sulfate ABC transporter permease subunit CysT [Aliidongia sp.]HEV2673451.1 sulfate ABC transporter permease subunit CysT [Aliidongia sp.]
MSADGGGSSATFPVTSFGAAPRRRSRRVLPGLPGTLGFTVFYLSLVVLLPLMALVLRAAGVGLDGFVAQIISSRVQAAFRASFGIAFLAALIDMGLGLLVAWVLVRYRFWGRRLLDALVDLPIALPTAVAGIALTELYAETGWFGAPLAALGIPVAFTPLGIGVALAFVGLPFVVRAVEPVLVDLDRDVEEAAATLGASSWQIFRRVILPPLWPALLTGFTLAFGRGIGEYGSVIFIAGNQPGLSEIVPLLIVVKLEQFDVGGAAVLGSLMLLASFAIMLTINALQTWSQRRLGP